MGLVVFLALLLSVTSGRAAELQYRLDTLRVTGFRTTAQGPIPEVAGYGRVTGLPDTHLSSVVQPADCALDLVDFLSFLTVTDTTTGAMSMQNVVCFDNTVVSTKKELRRRLQEAIARQDLNLAEIYIARCSGGSPPAVCPVIVQLMNPTAAEWTALTTLITTAQSKMSLFP